MQINILYYLIFVLSVLSCNSDTALNNNTTTENSIVQDTVVPTPNLPINTNTSISGERLFYAKCSGCHVSNQINNSTGPALGGITSRRTKDWLYAFTRDNQEMINRGDTAAINIYNTWLSNPMNAFPDLTDVELDSLYSFIEATYRRNKPIIRIRRVWLE